MGKQSGTSDMTRKPWWRRCPGLLWNDNGDNGDTEWETLHYRGRKALPPAQYWARGGAEVYTMVWRVMGGAKKRIAIRSEPRDQIMWADQTPASLLQVVVALEPYLELVTWEAPAVDWYPCQYSFWHSSKVSVILIHREDNPPSVKYPIRNKYLPSACTIPLSPSAFEAHDEDKGSLIFRGFEWCKCWHNWPCKLVIPTTHLDFRMCQIRLQVSCPHFN